MTWEQAVAAVAYLPRIEVAMSYGTPALKVSGKLIARLRDEDGSLVLTGIEPEEAAMLIAADPDTFHITPHYKGYRVVLARLAMLDADRLIYFIERRWRAVAQKQIVKAYNNECN